ncbi:FmdE family protein [Parasporobacterium paucivorans]|uniref:Formylmethanofuran dehydrogenase subunit E n=1 Tax=Parasporobacterium paucivorans DSM 15970 TaxID=1122934 RepID=A0A1M6EK10_9FIRM|nr:FmdE family protein [Parasporobacterium paucivorans]SHI85865.1 formylmethanofuran dehydrogenase subunit E [Parasporobacterium paucivorans DSM 15970]
MKNSFRSDLENAIEFHGHLCGGIIMGVRMARAAMDYLGIDEPEKNRDFIVYVENDRCISDAIQSVTGCSLGKRRLKWLDYGKMAASFIDMDTKKGIRLAVNADRNPEPSDDLEAFWGEFEDEELFKMEPVSMDLKMEDMPGKPSRSVNCEICHEKIMDGRDVAKDGKIVCKSCANGKYYSKIPL